MDSPGSAADNEARIMAVKAAKVRELRSRGVDPYPHRFQKTHPISEIVRLGGGLDAGARSEHRITTAGRVVQFRPMGKASFLHLQDVSGRGQVYARQDALAGGYDLLKNDVALGDYLGVSGAIFKSKTGEPTLEAAQLTLLSKALRPLPDKWAGLQDTDIRYRKRHLDLIANAEVRALFAARSAIVSAIRATLDGRGFLEVETPILLPQAGGAAATPFKTLHRALDRELSLRIATELYLKRLIIGGLDKVYEIGRIFRNEGIDTRHNPEFTMLEAYEAYSDYHGMAALFESMLDAAARAAGVESVEYRGQPLKLAPPFRRLKLPELWRERCAEDIHQVLEGQSFNAPRLRDLAGRLGVESAPDTPPAKVFERIFDSRILPLLHEPAFVLDHPTAVTPLAKTVPGDPALAERFEFFMGTEECANAYTELNDPLDQRERFQEQARQRASGDAETDILDEDFVQAMEAGMPPTGGIGVGIDRLAMVLTGKPSIREVILFPTLKAE